MICYYKFFLFFFSTGWWLFRERQWVED